MNPDSRFSKYLSREEIKKIVVDLGARISSQYGADEAIDMLWLADGAMFFAADLARAVSVDVRLYGLKVSSYGNGFSACSAPVIDGDLSRFKGRDVIVVDDVFDTGATLAAVKRALLECGAASVRTCVFAKKNSSCGEFAQPDFFGAECGGDFLVGYGMDFRGGMRNMADIYVFNGRYL